MLVVVSSCGYVFYESYLDLTMACFDGSLNKNLIPDYGFWIMGVGDNNSSMLFYSRK